MIARHVAAAALTLALLAPAGARAAGQPCSVTVSGAASGTFPCTVDVQAVSRDRVRFVFSPKKLSGDLRIFTAQVDVPREDLTGGGLKPVTPSVAALLVVTTSRASYVAGRGKGAQGDLTVELDAAPRKAKDPRSKVVAKHGAVKARLIPAQDAKGEVLVELKF
jgi:hypothetical protein